MKELVGRAPDELRRCHERGLRACVLASPHLRSLRRILKGEADAVSVLVRVVGGDKTRRNEAGEQRLRWLGILGEDGATAWKWTVPAFEEWAAQWLH